MSNATFASDLLFEDDGLRRSLSRWAAPQDADDALQVVAEKLLRSGGEANLSRRYISRAVRNAVIDHKRATQSRSAYESEYVYQCSQTDERSPERVTEGVQAIEALDNAVADLPPLTQEVFLLYYIGGRSQQDIATQFRLHLSTVEKRLAKAKRYCFERVAPHLA